MFQYISADMILPHTVPLFFKYNSNINIILLRLMPIQLL